MTRSPASAAVLVALAVTVSTAGVALAGAGPAVARAQSTQTTQETPPCAGTVEEPARGTTVVSVQGARGGNKTVARQVGFGPEGRVVWTYPAGNGNATGYEGVVWSYDVDPMENGHLFVTATVPGRTVLYELDPANNSRVWSETLDLLDTHDADLLGDGRVLVANMRNHNASTGVNEDRLAVYDRHADEFVWEWHFDDHYPPSVGGSYEEDWTHVNDVDRIGEGLYLASPRNFDQVVVVNRSSGEIELQLGSDGDYDVLKEQHNPDYLETRGGDPTVLVGDSENDRVVEYTKRGGSWTRTWTLGNESTFHWPRDADRLPNGNTLVTDSRNHRVLEVTPGGQVVWEVYTPWLPYDAERVRYGDGSRGPTVSDLNASGDPPLRGSAGGHGNATRLERCADRISEFENGSLDFTIATPTPTPTVTPTPTPTPAATTDGEVPDDGSTGSTGPGPGPVVALAALALGLVLVVRVRRRRS